MTEARHIVSNIGLLAIFGDDSWAASLVLVRGYLYSIELISIYGILGLQ